MWLFFFFFFLSPSYFLLKVLTETWIWNKVWFELLFSRSHYWKVGCMPGDGVWQLEEVTGAIAGSREGARSQEIEECWYTHHSIQHSIPLPSPSAHANQQSFLLALGYMANLIKIQHWVSPWQNVHYWSWGQHILGAGFLQNVTAWPYYTELLDTDL